MAPRPSGILVIAIAASAAGLLTGCASPDSVAAFDAPDPAARFRAARQAVQSNDASAIPGLINMLASDDPAERLIAIRALESLTGQTLGYDYSAVASDREAAAQRWSAWYADRSTSGTPVSPTTGKTRS